MKNSSICIAWVCVFLVCATQCVGQTEQTAERTKPVLEWVSFPDAGKFKVLGLPWFEQNQPNLCRMPKSQFSSLPEGVKRQSKESSGARLLLKCDTGNLGLRVLARNKGAQRGIDVYVDGKFYKAVVAEEPNVEADLFLFREFDRKPREILIYLPQQQELLVKAIGVDPGTKFSAPEHKFARPEPVVFYGSSVCQGNGAFKPGMTYPAAACRGLNLDFVNLGFGGAGKAESNVVALVNSIEACCYVFDLGKSYGSQDSSAFLKMLQAIREKHPKTPIICITPITSALELHSRSYTEKSLHTRAMIREATQQFLKSGQKQVELIEGADLFGFDDHDGLSKDGVHPCDFGYGTMAARLAPKLKNALGLK